ncbi:PIR protein [Plasmodium yoelii]|uniref:PIR protein n=2 Tax=Plasmodium yoelii TaxID=5861 RepID=A0AAE9WT42_PLAYO|nr:PIR protein [Plasmodium yoelii]XP_034493606.1 PIR protein [Plasmodium yoelii]WBY59604.1 PIR protein [Plasmodium yoelii yoelii]WBY59632.1 PIR protein [Plasmodium yoelii yoelii]VTZ80346.1 PIR protein [Plasmodium yoelii]VTZ80372.1 PIR protein [Plasmodium yoelii]|eukprot:XP_034493594.1 PIR protein [Plasmodium yoelii]
MNKEVCKKFQDVWTNLEYDSSSEIYKFKDNKDFKEYCTNENCDNDLDNISAGCLYLFNEIFGNPTSFSFIAKGNTNIVEYILIWLSYMLNYKRMNENDSIEPFYEIFINKYTEYNKYNKDNKYNEKIVGVTDYENYKDLIDKKQNLMSISTKDMSKFYDVFILLCDMYIEFETNSDCNKFSGQAKEFAKKYDELNEDYNNGKGSPYNQLLSTLSNDYNNLKNKCNDFPSLPTYSRRLVIKRTLIPIAFIFVAVSIFLGIAYKYSLFGFRKRFQKQCLRERIKNIKKKLIINKLF